MNQTNKKITIALTGNPNCGKTTIFNNLTGDRQHVGNYPGVTVEKKEGFLDYNGTEVKVVDLPGTYSLTALSLDEQVARTFIINEKPDVVVNIIDYSNLERNLYLTTQLIEMKTPLVLIFNMSDVAVRRGIEYDLNKLSALLGAPIVSTIGSEGNYKKDIIKAVLDVISGEVEYSQPEISYGKDIENEIGLIENVIIEEGLVPENYDSQWLALKLLENDLRILKPTDTERIYTTVQKSTQHIESIHHENPEIHIADHRYKFISKICKKAAITTSDHRPTRSDRIDRILTNHIFGLPIFFALMFLVFHLTFTLGEIPMGWIESFFGWSSVLISGLWQPGSESMLKSLLVDGIIGGVGGVIIFLPNILLLFLALSILEDSGYMPRAVFILDRVMEKIGLHGRSFMPMMIGFGCTIPAIMATRTLGNRRDRLVTMMILPLMSCGARFPIYALIIPAFFPDKYRGGMLFLMYIIGIGSAILLAKLLKTTVLKGTPSPLIMELPPYKVPPLRSVLTNMWEKSWMYLRKAGTVILGVSIVLWVLTSYPQKAEITATESDAIQAEQLSYSVAGRIGMVMEPVIKPMGFDWRIGTAMIGAFAAKEVFVSQLGIIYSVGDADQESGALRDKLARNYTPLTGFTIMLFMLLSMPCMATIAVTKQESGSWKWAMLQLGGLTAFAYIMTALVFQIGSLLGIGV
ncbi:MAG: ferrous iron transport protein B [Calditrichaeota bacterium]|nr:ferrous iron transport protein B [Calditrichota bacterium]